MVDSDCNDKSLCFHSICTVVSTSMNEELA